MNANKLQFRVHSVRTQSSPYSKEDKEESTLETIHYLLVNLRDLPAGISLEVNPRKPKMSTNVGRSLEAAVIEPETDFYINNRGIVISAKAFSFNSANSTVTVDLGNQKDAADAELYGILDGGHTYTAILKKRAAIPPGLDKYVRVEVITNVQNIARLSDARNTSMQVSDIALFNLDEKFEDVRAAIQDQPYASRVAYKDNDNQDIHVSFFLRLLFAFDILRYPDDASAPVQSFSGKAHVFKCYSEDYETPFYKSLTPHLPTLAALYDQIELEIPQRYKEYKMAMGGQKPNFGNVRGIERLGKEIPTMLFGNPTEYQISSGYIYPIFGAFRCLLRFDQEAGQVSWLFDPLELWKEVGTSLVQNTFESSRNPQLAGKDKQLWLANYRIVETQSLRKLLETKMYGIK